MNHWIGSISSAPEVRQRNITKWSGTLQKTEKVCSVAEASAAIFVLNKTEQKVKTNIENK